MRSTGAGIRCGRGQIPVCHRRGSMAGNGREKRAATKNPSPLSRPESSLSAVSRGNGGSRIGAHSNPAASRVNPTLPADLRGTPGAPSSRKLVQEQLAFILAMIASRWASGSCGHEQALMTGVTIRHSSCTTSLRSREKSRFPPICEPIALRQHISLTPPPQIRNFRFQVTFVLGTSGQ